ncbi:thioredoxin 1 [Treponema pedis]
MQLSPELEAAEAEVGDKAVISACNVDNARELAAKFKFMTIPTLILFKNGKEVDRHSGYLEKSELVQFVSKHI